jgi:hypothetical protein
VARVLKFDIPGTDWRIPLDEACERGFCDVFASDVARPSPLVVEIGFGRGEFLMDLALRHPEQAFVGIEVSFKRTLKMARRLARTELRNVRLVEGTAESTSRTPGRRRGTSSGDCSSRPSPRSWRAASCRAASCT